MAGVPHGASGTANRPWLRHQWDAPDVLCFYAGSPFSNFAHSPI
jgi:ribA/ribD-fused uncharacterized protein